MERSSDRFAALESRMLGASGASPAHEFSIGFRPPSNPPSNSALELRSPSPSQAAAVHSQAKAVHSQAVQL